MFACIITEVFVNMTTEIFVCMKTKVFVYMTTEVIAYLTTKVSVYTTTEVLFTWQQKCFYCNSDSVCLFVCLHKCQPLAVYTGHQLFHQYDADKRSDRCGSVAGDGRSRRAAANKQDIRSSYLIIKTEKTKLLGVITNDNLKWDAHM